jgi:predicted Ser/Thr protein kinase
MENTLVGRCRLLRKLGEGGMGQVWLARHETLQKDVAVKVLPENFAGNAEARERFLREARAAARLEHPNVIQVLDAGSANGQPFIVMQYVDGTDLERVLRKKGKLSVDDALSIGKKVALALAAAHKLGIVHRDIKPANVMITKQGRVMVGDFGLARPVDGGGTITTEGMIMGTPHFIAPEQARGEKVDGRSDLYSLGATLYSLIGGRYPFSGNSPMSIAVKHATPTEKPEALRKLDASVPAEVDQLVQKLMAKRPEDRFQTGDELAQAIDRVKHGPGTMVTVSEDRVLTPRKRRRLLIKGALAGIFLLFGLIFFLVLISPKPGERALREAAELPSSELKLLRYREITIRFEGTEWAKRAQRAAEAVASEAATKETAEAARQQAAGKLSFGEYVSRLDQTRARYPEAKAAIDGRETDAHRVRVLARTEKLAAALKSDRAEAIDEIKDLIHPEILRRQGAGATLFWIRVGVGFMLGVKGRFEEIELYKDALRIKPRESATLPARSVIHRAQTKERAEMRVVIEWTWVEGDWYLGEKGIQPER